MAETASSSSNNRILYIIIAILGLAVLFLLWQLSNTKSDVAVVTEEFNQLDAEKSELEIGLQEMLAQYETAVVESDTMKARVMQQKEEIQALLERVKKLKGDDSKLRWEIDKLKKESGTLREIMKGYLVTIDSLNTKNQALTGEVENLTTSLTTANTKKDELANTVSEQSDIIKAGSVLTSVTFTAEAIRVKSTGNQKTTSRASKAEMVKSCVKLAKNAITKKGPKTLYVRVISPEGTVLDDKNNMGKTFNFNNVSGKYSAKRQFEYDGESKDLCVFHTINSELTAGQYIVEMYESGTIIGKTSFDLR